MSTPRTSSTSTRRSRASRQAAANRHQGRLVVTLATLTFVALGLFLRLALYQIVDHGQLTAKAATFSSQPPTQTVRGPIVDDAGNVLALSDDIYDVQAAPAQIVRPWVVARTLAPILHVSRPKILRLLHSSSVNVVLKRKVNQLVANAVMRQGLLGISLAPNPNRVYPEGAIGAHVLGFAADLKDGVLTGQYGVEQEYNALLNGSLSARAFRGWAMSRHDRVVHGNNPASTAPYMGASLRLSIDTYVQEEIQQILKRRVRATDASSGTVIVSEPKTGHIVALANYPTFNPNYYSSAKLWKLADSAIDDTYEPGSTFKIITMAAGINSSVITPKTTIEDPGWALYPKCSPIMVRNWNYPVSNGRETMTQVLQHSANVGASYVANRLGVRRFYHYVRRFGVGSPTGIDLPSEASGLVPLPHAPGSNWTCVNLYDNSFGQALTVTPIQLLSEVNTVANGGLLIRPSIVNEINYRGITAYSQPYIDRRVISRRTAHTVTSMLVNSALGPPGSYGEAACALVPGYTIAAKTGTADLVNPRTQKYRIGPGSTIASTIGYAPAHHPRFSVLVVIRKPKADWVNSQWGSESAAPVVHDVFAALFLHFHVNPTAANSARVRASQAAFGGCNF